jgi:flagellar hook-length control protein FliK
MSLEIKSAAAAAPSAAPVLGAAKGPSVGASKANPFGSLLAGLDAAQQPQRSDIIETDVPAAAIIPSEPALQVAVSPAPERIDSSTIFISPAFNSRLALAQTEDIAKAAPVSPSDSNAVSSPPEGAAQSLLAMLAAKSRAPVASAIAALNQAAPEAEVVAEATAVVATDTILPTLLIAENAVALPEEAETDVSVEVETDTAVVAAPAVAAPPVLAVPRVMLAEFDTATTQNVDDSASMQSAAPVSLFDKLAQLKDSQNSKDALPVDAVVVTDVGSALVAPVSTGDTTTVIAPVIDTKVAESMIQPQSSVSDNAPAFKDLPQVTMRPISSAQMVEGVSVLLARASKNQVNEFIIRMDPPELGRIDVKMKMHDDGSIQAVIASDNVNTYDLLRREASTIERALSDSGFRTGNDGLSFNLKQQANDQNGSAFGKANNGSVNADSAALEDEIPASVLAPLRQRYQNARININA